MRLKLGWEVGGGSMKSGQDGVGEGHSLGEGER